MKTRRGKELRLRRGAHAQITQGQADQRGQSLHQPPVVGEESPCLLDPVDPLQALNENFALTAVLHQLDGLTEHGSQRQHPQKQRPQNDHRQRDPFIPPQAAGEQIHQAQDFQNVQQRPGEALQRLPQGGGQIRFRQESVVIAAQDAEISVVAAQCQNEIIVGDTQNQGAQQEPDHAQNQADELAEPDGKPRRAEPAQKRGAAFGQHAAQHQHQKQGQRPVG